MTILSFNSRSEEKCAQRQWAFGDTHSFKGRVRTDPAPAIFADRISLSLQIPFL